jgi:peroxiredoxin
MSTPPEPDELAPDFTLVDVTGKKIQLADYRERSWVLLVFNRGFM